jgi:hypothetical protein
MALEGRWGVSITPRPLFSPGKDPVPIVQEAGWAPGPVWTFEEILASIGIRSPDRPARSESLYRLRYPALRKGNTKIIHLLFFDSLRLLTNFPLLHTLQVKRIVLSHFCYFTSVHTLRPKCFLLLRSHFFFKFLLHQSDDFLCSECHRTITNDIRKGTKTSWIIWWKCHAVCVCHFISLKLKLI